MEQLANLQDKLWRDSVFRLPFYNHKGRVEMPSAK